MKVYIDDEHCALGGERVGDVVAAAADRVQSQGRVIVDVFVDGERWNETQLADQALSASGAQEVRLVSADPAALVEYVLSQAVEAIDQIEALQKTAAEALQAGRRREAMDRLGEAVELWLAVQQAVASGSNMIDMDLDSIVLPAREGEPAQTPIAAIAQLQDQLRSVRNCLKVSDTIGLADTLLYELPEVVGRWRDMLLHLQTLAAATPGNSGNPGSGSGGGGSTGSITS